MVHNQEEVVVHSEEVDGMGVEALVQQEESSHKIGPAIPVAKVGFSEPAGPIWPVRSIVLLLWVWKVIWKGWRGFLIVVGRSRLPRPFGSIGITRLIRAFIDSL